MTEFLGRNDLNIAELFFERVSYSRLAFPQGNGSLYVKPVSDFLFAERMLYGRIDKQHNVIQANASFTKRIKSQASPKKQLTALNFVVDAFEELVEEMNIQGLAGKLDRNDPYLGQIRAHTAFVSPKTMYANYLSALRDLFLNVYITREIDEAIIDFNSFVPIFMTFLEKAAEGLPTTKGSYIASNLCSPMVSGLTINLTDLDPSDDSQKQQFLDSPNFPLLVLAAKKFGFFIDKFVPWRLTADIASSPMLRYSNRYGANSERAVLNNYFQLVGGSDIVDLQRMAVDFYNAVVLRRPTLRVYRGTQLTVVCRQPIGFENIERFYPIDYWVDKYVDIRYIEKRRPGSLGQLSALKKTVKNLLSQFQLRFVLSYINLELQGFDNFEGSFAKTSLKQSNQRNNENFQPTY